jgi:hypothetical protein
MSLFSNPQEHAANPPESWVIVRAGRRYRLQTASGIELASFERKRTAEDEKVGGMYVNLYRKESRWYAGESVDGWKPYRSTT